MQKIAKITKNKANKKGILISMSAHENIMNLYLLKKAPIFGAFFCK